MKKESKRSSKNANRRHSLRPDPEPEIVLFSVLGMSPAVLTETVWKLAHEKTAILPSRVVVLTTTEGARQVREKLLTPNPAFRGQTVWTALRATLGHPSGKVPEPDIHIFKIRGETNRELADIVTPDDHAIVADTILEELRKFIENPDCRIVASIAGGRKTMGALLYACMTLIARETDRITHVLVPPPYDQPGHQPPFFFPYLKSQISNLKSPLITLADIPFVPLRNRFAELGRMPGAFTGLIAHYSRKLKNEIRAKVRLDKTRDTVVVNDSSCRLSHRVYLTLEFLVEHRESHLRQKEAIDPFTSFLDQRDPSWAKTSTDIGIDLKRCLSDLRKALEKVGIAWKPGLRHDSLRLPPFDLVKES